MVAVGVYLSDAIVIMTSNVGSEHFRKPRNPFGFLSGEVSVDGVQADVRRDVERRFSPEFLNLIDEVVLFSPLTPEDRAIATQYVSAMMSVFIRSGKMLVIGDEALDAIVRPGHSQAYGARFLKRVIDERVKQANQRELTQGTLSRESRRWRCGRRSEMVRRESPAA